MADTTNLDEADKTLGLNTQERDLYNRHLENLYGTGGVDNPDGSRSTLRATTVGAIGDNTKHYVVPTVHEGKILSDEAAIAKADEGGIDRFPSYPTPEDAQRRYDAIHSFMEKDTKQYLDSKAEPVPLHPEYFDSSLEAPSQDRSQLPIDEQYFGEGARAIGEQNPVIQTIDKLKDIPGRPSETPGPIARGDTSPPVITEWTGNPKELTVFTDHLIGLAEGIAKGERNAKADAAGETIGRLIDAVKGKPTPPEQIVNDLMSVEPFHMPLKGLGNLLRSMGVLGPVEKDVAKPISRELMSDASPDPLQAGQQYAMMENPNLPGMQGLTAEIDRQAGGFVSGPAGTGRQRESITDLGLKTYKADLKSDIKKGVFLTKTGEDQTYEGHPLHLYSFTKEGGRKGELHISEKDNGKNIHIEWAGIQTRRGEEHKVYDIGPQAFGLSDMRSVLKQIRKEFPEAEVLSGFRVSGVRQKSGGGSEETFLPLKPGVDLTEYKKKREEDRLANRARRVVREEADRNDESVWTVIPPTQRELQQVPFDSSVR